MRDHALYLRSLGVAVHLLHYQSKRPVGSDWASAPVLTPEQLAAVDYSNYNLGVRPGTWSRLPGGLCLGIIDFDISPECTQQEREEAYAAIRSVMHGTAAGPVIISGSGGESRHFWVALPEDMATTVVSESARKIQVADGNKHVWEVRVLFTGANAVVPPSIHPDTLAAYQWAQGHEPWTVAIPALAEEGLQQIRSAKKTYEIGDMPEIVPAWELPPPGALSMPEDVRAFLEEGTYCPGKDGNASVQRAANQLYRMGLDDSVVLSYLVASPGSYQVAAKRRGEDFEAIADWLWKYACTKGKEFAPPKADEVFEEVVPAQLPSTAPPAFLQISSPQATQVAMGAIRTFEDIMAEAVSLGELDDPKPLLRQSLHLDPIQLDKLAHVIASKCGVKLKSVEEQIKLLKPKGMKNIDQDLSFYDNFFYISEQDAFYDPARRIMLNMQAFNNTYAHLDESPATQALVHNRVAKVDKIDYRPGLPRLFQDKGVTYLNGWTGIMDHGAQGDVERWLQHWDVLGWTGEQKKHALQWMAFTLKHPERKINHILLLGGGEGNGKDFLLYPLSQALADDAQVIDADELLADFNDYLLATKYLHINEAELGDRREANQVTNKLKRMAARPPETLRVNQKGIKPIKVQNLVNISMSTNSRIPLKLNNGARRYYALWTNVTVRGEDGQMPEDWKAYWHDRWSWMRDHHGWRACVWYLENCVDLSDFDPGAVPMVTDFVREIQEDSQSPLESLMRELADTRTGMFACDLVKAKDLHMAMQVNVALREAYGLRETPGVKLINQVATQSGMAVPLMAREGRGTYGSSRRSLLCLRNLELYKQMSEADRYDEYLRQMEAAATQSVPVE